MLQKDTHNCSYYVFIIPKRVNKSNHVQILQVNKFLTIST